MQEGVASIWHDWTWYNSLTSGWCCVAMEHASMRNDIEGLNDTIPTLTANRGPKQ